MIVSNTPPPSKYWSVDQKTWYDICLKDKNCTLAYYMTDKKGYPVFSPNKKGWKAVSGKLQKIMPLYTSGHDANKPIPCSHGALHATNSIENWISVNCKIWVVGMIKPIVDDNDKICSLKRRIIGCYHPNELNDSIRFITYPNFDLNQKNKLFKNLNIKSRQPICLSDIDFTGADFKDCYIDNIIFKNCNFTLVGFANTRIDRCKFINCEFSNTRVYNKSTVSDLNIVGKIKDFIWCIENIPNGFVVENSRLIRKGKNENSK